MEKEKERQFSVIVCFFDLCEGWDRQSRSSKNDVDECEAEVEEGPYRDPKNWILEEGPIHKRFIVPPRSSNGYSRNNAQDGDTAYDQDDEGDQAKGPSEADRFAGFGDEEREDDAS